MPPMSLAGAPGLTPDRPRAVRKGWLMVERSGALAAVIATTRAARANLRWVAQPSDLVLVRAAGIWSR